MKNALILITAAIICTSCSVMCTNRNNLKKSFWTSEYHEFVADVGNETVTATLEFTSSKDFVFTEKAVMPPYPAMYMNSDGSVDTMPGYSREYSYKGTYSVKKGTVTLTTESGEVKTLQLDGNTLKSNDPLTYRLLTFTRSK